jgi:hypothetical protein
MCAALFRLDPQLAQMPLAGGLSPQVLASRTLAARLNRGLHTYKRGLSKYIQVLKGSPRPPIGTAALARALVPQLGPIADSFPRVSSLRVFDSNKLELARSGNAIDANTLSALLWIEWLHQFLDHA